MKKETLDKSINLNIAKTLISGDFLNNERLNYLNKTIGAYIIYVCSSGKVYIGSASNLYTRRNTHLSKLNNNIHLNKNLQNEFNSVANNKIIFIIYPTTTREKAYDLEQIFLDCYNGNPKLLNIAKNARLAQTGLLHSDETKVKLVAAMATRTSKPEHGNNISKHALLRFSDSSERKKQSDRIKRAWANPETRIKMLAANKAKGKMVKINDIIYPSIIDASRQLGVDSTGIINRLRSPKYPLWSYINETT